MYKYEHGGDIYSEQTTADGKQMVDFSANINPLGLPLGVKEALKAAIKECGNYPDPFCRKLREATAAYLDVKPEYLFFGNGASDLLFRLAVALKPTVGMVYAPTFADYAKALQSVKCRVKNYYLLEENDFLPTRDIVGKMAVNTKIFILCNPNNPTGQITSRATIERLLQKCRVIKCKLLVDECFMDLVDPAKAFSMRDLLEEYPEIIILKAFTKTFAMPGVRLGYLMCSDKELLEKLYKSGQDWSVSVLAQAAGIAALKEKEYLHESLMLLQEERKYLISQLKALGARVYGSEANYIFFYLPYPQNLEELLRQQGYIIRSCANYENLGQGYYRIAVKTRVLNRGLIKAIKEVKKHALFTNIN